VIPWKRRTTEEINRGTALNLGLETEQSYDLISREKKKAHVREKNTVFVPDRQSNNQLNRRHPTQPTSTPETGCRSDIDSHSSAT